MGGQLSVFFRLLAYITFAISLLFGSNLKASSLFDELPLFDQSFDNPNQVLSDLIESKDTKSVNDHWNMAKSALLASEVTIAKEHILILDEMLAESVEGEYLMDFLKGWLAISEVNEDETIALLQKPLAYFREQKLKEMALFTQYLLASAWISKSFYLNSVPENTVKEVELLLKDSEELNVNIGYAIAHMTNANRYSINLDIEKVLVELSKVESYLENEKYRSILAEIYASKGWAHYRLDHHSDAEAYTRKAIDMFKELNLNGYVAQNYLLLSYLFETMNGREPEQYETLQFAIEYFQKSEDKYGLADAIRSLGLLVTKENPNQALAEFEKAKALFLTIGETEEVAITIMNIAQVYEQLNQDDEFIDNIKQAKEILNSEGAWIPLLRLLRTEIGFYKEREINKSFVLNEEYIKFSKEHGDPPDLVFGYMQKGELLLFQSDMSGALVAYLAAQKLNKNDEVTDMDINKALSQIYFELEEYQKAYQYLKKTFDYESVRFTDEYANRLSEMQNQIQNQAQQHQIESLEKEQRLNEAILKQNEAEIARQNLLIQSAIVVAIPSFAILFLLYNRRTMAKQQLVLKKLVASATDEIARQHDSISALLNNADEGFLSCDESLVIQGAHSSACQRILGCSPSGKRIDELLYQHDQNSGQLLKEKLFIAMSTSDANTRADLLASAPKEVVINQRNIEVEYQFIDEHQLMFVLRDVTERNQMLAELEKASVTDKLTGLFNRHKLDEILEIDYERSARGGYTFSVILLDVDHFKSVNDNFGHNNGDLVLKEVAQLLKKRVRKSDLVGRWGGEEFIIVCPNTELEQAASLAEEVRANIAKQQFNNVGNITASFGLAEHKPKESLKELLHRADTALYSAKETGRNKVVMDSSSE